jgi:hypothetical protein
MKACRFEHIYGVDFSGAKKAGENTWVARLVPASLKSNPHRLRLINLHRLADLAGTADREPALRTLVALVRQSEDALWAFDFPRFARRGDATAVVVVRPTRLGPRLGR